MDLSIVPLEKYHRRDAFDCGNEQLNSYLKKQARQDSKRKLAVCFALLDNKSLVKGYYTLSNSGINRSEVPESISSRMPPSYHQLPVTLLGRLAVDVSMRGQGMGGRLLADALKRSLQVSKTQIGSMAVIVDPIDDLAVKFYDKYGFISLSGSDKMFLPMKTIAQIL